MTIEKIGKVLLDVYKMYDEVKELGLEVKDLAKEVREIDRRVIRIETMIEVADKQSSRSRPTLPDGDE